MTQKRSEATKRRKAPRPGLQGAKKGTKRPKALRPGLEKAKKHQCERRRERVLTDRAVAAGASKVTFRQGVQLYDSSDDGTYFVLFKRESRRLEIEGGAHRSFDGAYYHACGEAGVDGSNYKEMCDWSSISEIEKWVRSSRRGDGVTGNLFMNAADRAFNFTGSSGHPLLREGTTQKNGYWSSSKGNAEARKQATSALSRLSKNLKDPTTRGATLTLMKQTHSVLELVASGIFAALRGGPRVARGKDDDERDFVATTKSTFVASELLYVLERLLKMAGWVETDGGTWRPINDAALVRIFGPNALKSGRNALKRLKHYKSAILRKYYTTHPDAAVAQRKYFFLLSQISQVDDSIVSAAANEELGPAALGPDGRPFPAWMLRNKMEEKRTAGHPFDPRVEWVSFVRFGDALDFSLTIKPKSLVPYKGTSIPLGADIVARFAWKTMRRGDAPSGPTPMM